MCKFGATLSIILLINLALLSSTFAETDDGCKTSQKDTGNARLREYLFCNYPWFMPGSPNGKNVTEVHIALQPMLSSFNEEDGTLRLTTKTYVYWDDPYFEWDPEQYENLQYLRVKSQTVWQPDIAVLSAGNEESNYHTYLWNAECIVWAVGTVSCMPKLTHTIRCQTDFTQWPYDRQNCTLMFSTWLRPSETIRFGRDFYANIDMSTYSPNEEWRLTLSRISYDERDSSHSMRKNATLPRQSVDFILDRAHNQLSGRYISPAIIMMVMTLTTLWLDPRSLERLSVSCVNPIIHLYCMQELHWVLPHNGNTVPNLLLFYANSMVLATIALILTFVLGSLQETKIEPPKWISSTTAEMLRSKVGQILLLSMLDPKVAAELEPDADDAGDLISPKSKTTAWGYVTIVCGWITFITFFFTYVIMYAVLVPNSSMRPPLMSPRS